MALSSTSRWVVVGSLKIRAHQRARNGSAQLYTLAELAEALRALTNRGHRWYNKRAHSMWCSHVWSDKLYCFFLLHDANSNAADTAYYNLQTSQTRYIEKKVNEGGLYSSHVLVRKDPDHAGRHLVLIEKVPGIYLSSVKSHFGWAVRSSPNDHPQKTDLPVFELDGYQSTTLGEALDRGILQDIELVRVDKHYSDGIDEDASGVDESIHSVSLRPKPDASKSQVVSMVRRIGSFRNRHFGEHPDTQAYIRIKTNDGQIKRSEIHNMDRDAVLEEAFVHNEIVKGFRNQLRTTYEEPSKEMASKLAEIGGRLCGST